jgi:hypothetical protein
MICRDSSTDGRIRAASIYFEFSAVSYPEASRMYSHITIGDRWIYFTHDGSEFGVGGILKVTKMDDDH